MKTNLIIIALSLITTVSFAQEASKEKLETKATSFSARSGTLIQKVYTEVGSIGKAEVKVVHYTDMISLDKISSVRFELEVATKYSTDTKIASLDADELDGLLKSIKIIQDRILSVTPSGYTEVTYKSRGGFQAGCYWSENASTWMPYMKLEKYDGKSYVLLSDGDIPTLISLIEKAKGLL